MAMHVNDDVNDDVNDNGELEYLDLYLIELVVKYFVALALVLALEQLALKMSLTIILVVVVLPPLFIVAVIIGDNFPALIIDIGGRKSKAFMNKIELE